MTVAPAPPASAAGAPAGAAPRSLAARAVRSGGIATLGFLAAQVLRFGSNLLLTRLLFPEAFGMMALVSVVLMALAMLSDLGIGPSIVQSPRGDDPDFLDTAWTIQIVRGGLLWLLALALTPLIAALYDEPDLNAYLPVAALSLAVAAFYPTKLETQNRHLRAGRVTLVDLCSQVASLAVAALLAWLTRSVWALVISGVAASLLQLAMLHLALPGRGNRLRWEPAAARELIHFGKWILLATLCGFVALQADRAMLGRLLPLGEFGLYNIAAFLASVPMMLGNAVGGRVLIPLYRDSPPAASAENRARIRRLRGGALAVLLALATLLGTVGPWLVAALYDPRYHAAGGVVTLVAVMQAPGLLMVTCDRGALATGQSRRFFVLTLARAATVVAGLGLGWAWGGLAGAIVGQGLGTLAAYPVLAWTLRPLGAWDWKLDAAFGAAALACGALALAVAGLHPAGLP